MWDRINLLTTMALFRHHVPVCVFLLLVCSCAVRTFPDDSDGLRHFRIFPHDVPESPQIQTKDHQTKVNHANAIYQHQPEVDKTGSETAGLEKLPVQKSSAVLSEIQTTKKSEPDVWKDKGSSQPVDASEHKLTDQSDLANFYNKSRVFHSSGHSEPDLLTLYRDFMLQFKRRFPTRASLADFLQSVSSSDGYVVHGKCLIHILDSFQAASTGKLWAMRSKIFVLLVRKRWGAFKVRFFILLEISRLGP